MIKKAGGVILDGRKILLIVKNDKLQFSKGHLKKKETIVQCAQREVEEETGFIEIELFLQKPVISYYQFTNFLGKHRDVKLYLFLFRLKSRRHKKRKWTILERVKNRWFFLDEAIKKAETQNVRKALVEIKRQKMVKLKF